MAYHDTVTNMMTANHKQAVEWSRLGHRIDLYKYREEYDDYVYVTNWTVEYEQAKAYSFFVWRQAVGRHFRTPAAICLLYKLHKKSTRILCKLYIDFSPEI